MAWNGAFCLNRMKLEIAEAESGFLGSLFCRVMR